MLRAALLVSIATSLGGCYLAHEREASCAPPTTATTCGRWEAAGTVTPISAPVPIGEVLQMTSAVTSGCGVVVAWYRGTGTPFPDTVSFETREIGWDGAPAADVRAHPALTVASSASGGLELAARDGSLGAVVGTEPGGCRFVGLDARGADRSAPVAIDAPWCTGIEPTRDGYSFVAFDPGMGTPGSIVRVDESGSVLGRMALDVPPGRALWSRTQLGDGSFVLYTFREDPVTAIYSGWLRHFDEAGAALAPEVEVGVNAVPVQLATTSAGALSAWETAMPGGLPMQTRAIDSDARPTSEIRDLPAEGAQYGLTLAAVPDGGALAVWVEDHFDETPEWRVRALALGPDGTPRGEPTLVLTGVLARRVQVLVDASGERALLVYDEDDGGASALPIRCAP
jgi:hypothetical protein